MASILIVDDEESIRFTYKRFLTDAGYDVAVASHFIEAKSLLPANEFEVAIVDRVLGESNGIELVKHIKEVQPFCEPVLISGFPSFKSASETLQYDVFAYLTKPILKKKLCQTVDGAVKKNRIKKVVTVSAAFFLSFRNDCNKITNRKIQTSTIANGGMISKNETCSTL